MKIRVIRKNTSNTPNTLNTPLENRIEQKLKELHDLANKRRGGAWTMGFCVVGKDMRIGIFSATNVIRNYNFQNGKSVVKQCEELAWRIRLAIDQYDGVDTEGFVVGTMLDIKEHIENLGYPSKP